MGESYYYRAEVSASTAATSSITFKDEQRPGGTSGKGLLFLFFFFFFFFFLLFVGCLTSQQHASVSQGRICEDKFTCWHTETEVADQTYHLSRSRYTDTEPTSPSADPITPGAWQGSRWSASFEVTGMTHLESKQTLSIAMY